jgi:hypothetical protein
MKNWGGFRGVFRLMKRCKKIYLAWHPLSGMPVPDFNDMTQLCYDFFENEHRERIEGAT